MNNATARGRNPWIVIWLLFFVQVINYFDKGIIGLAALPMTNELGLSREQYGLVASSFFSLYAVTGICVGLFAANRVRPKWLITVLVLIWSLAQFPIAFTSSLSTLIACRVILGVGEGPATPTSYNACFSWFPSDKRNLPMAVMTTGSGVGTLIGAPVLTAIIISFGWRAAFMACGVLGLVWLALWLRFGGDGPYAVESDVKSIGEPNVRNNLSQTTLWLDPTIVASIVVAFCAYWIVGFTIAWLPIYLQTALGYDALTAGWLLSATSASASIFTFITTLGSQSLLNRRVSSRVARGIVIGAALLISGLSLVLSVMASPGSLKIITLIIGCSFPLMIFTLGPTIVSEVAPPSQSRRVIVVIYSSITFAGLLSPMAAGLLMKFADPGATAGGYDYALLSNAAVLMIGGLVGLIWLNPESTIRRFS